MKKQISILTIAIFMMAMSAYATVWRVNNRPYVDADFTTLQAAIDGASAGDTLYIEGSTTSYGNGIFDKQLVVIGPGYWLDENDTTQAYKEQARTGRLTFNSGSEGTQVQGLYIVDGQSNSSYEASAVHINTDSISIKRNFIYAYHTHTTLSSMVRGIIINGPYHKIEINQNWIQVIGTPNRHTLRGIETNSYLINSTISNNMIRAATGSSISAIRIGSSSPANQLVINNNVIWGNITTYYSMHLNNILLEGTYNNGTGDLSSYNLCSGTQYPDANSNQQNVDMSTVFVQYDKYIDNGYLLAPGSPAIGAGINGGDCGVFGTGSGGDAYVLSGIPGIPAIFDATVTPMGTYSLPVNIKAKTNN